MLTGDTYMSELYHHGIKGQRWGVRRYQNKDGSLTDLGRKKLYETSKKVLDPDRDKSTQKNKEMAGIKSTSDSNTDIISKNSKIRRTANTGETVDTKRKYASLTDDDHYQYTSEIIYMMGIDINKPISEYTYTAKKDLKVASGKKVVDDLVNKYGDKSIRQLVTDLRKTDVNLYEYISYKDKKHKWMRDYTDQSTHKVNKFLKETLKKHGDEIFNEYKKHGYDAIVDAEDWFSKLAEYPVIILNPGDSLKFEKEERVR